MSRAELVILDCDGVLVDSERIGVEVDRRVLADLGWQLSVEEIVHRWVGRSEAAYVADIEQHLGRRLLHHGVRRHGPAARTAGGVGPGEAHGAGRGG